MIFVNGLLASGFLQTALDGKKELQSSSIMMATSRLETALAEFAELHSSFENLSEAPLLLTGDSIRGSIWARHG